MRWPSRFLFLSPLFVSLACSAEDDIVYEHPVTLEPEKTQALFRGLSGVWEVTLPAKVGTRVGRLELCEVTAPSSGSVSSVVMTSSETSPRAVILREVVEREEGGSGMGCSGPRRATPTPAVAQWRGRWTDETRTDGSSVSSVGLTAEFLTVTELYPDVYGIGIVADSYLRGTAPSLPPESTPRYAWFRLDGTLRATTFPSVYETATEESAELVFRKIGDATCDAAGNAASGGPDADAEDAGDDGASSAEDPDGGDIGSDGG